MRSVEPWPLRIARYGCVTDHPPVTPIFLSLSNEGFSEETCNKITQDADVVASPEFNRN